MDRVGFGAQIISQLPSVHSVLDVGCRDAKLAELLPRQIQYFGADLSAANPNVHYVGDFTTIDFRRTFHAVVALDILEHTEALSENFDKLARLAEHFLIVSLPNCADLQTRIRFLRKGRLGGKYDFDGSDPLDRHRWVMNYREINNFFHRKAIELGMDVRIQALTYGSGGRSTLTSRAGRLVSRVLPKSLTTSTVIALFSRKAWTPSSD